MNANGTLKRMNRILAVLALGLLVWTQKIQADPAELDLAFDVDGKVITDFAGGSDLGRAVKLQSDGKIVVAGRASSPSVNNDFGLTRYNSDGGLDSTFGASGRTSTDFAGNSDNGLGLAIQPDGRIIVVGSSSDGSQLDFALARYLQNGALDVTFGSGGKVITDFAGGNDEANDVALQTDGKIVVAGLMDSNSIDDNDFAVARYNSDGTLDTGFGVNGTVHSDFGGNNDAAYAVVIQPDGKIVVVGNRLSGSDTDFACVRYNPDGSLDTSFANSGVLTTDFAGLNDDAYGVAIQTDGKIMLVGSSDAGSNYNFALARYNSDGTLDTSFSFDGKVTTDFAGDLDQAIDVALQPDGKIVAAGVSSIGLSGNFALARYEADGTPDATFDTDGRVITDFGGNDAALGIVLQTDRKIILAGYSFDAMQNISDFAIARYQGDPLPPCIYCDDFEDGVLASDWDYVKPDWSESGGNLIATPITKKAEAIAAPAFLGCSLCTVEAVMSSSGGSGNKTWLLAWYTDKKNVVEVLMKEESDKWILKQRNGGRTVVKTKAVSTILPNVNYDVQVTFDGINLILVVDGVTLASIATPIAPNGTVGFRVKNSPSSFGSITVN